MTRQQAVVLFLLSEIEWVLLHPLVASMAVGAGLGVVAGSDVRRRARRRSGVRRAMAPALGQVTQPAEISVGSASPAGVSVIERKGSKGTWMRLQRYVRSDVREMTPATASWYAAALAAFGVGGFILRLPLRTRRASLRRVALEIVGNVVAAAVLVWFTRWMKLYQQKYGDDSERAAQDLAGWMSQRAGACPIPEDQRPAANP